jgi:pSer/pThr/pTyr-binding forkhead associated (FHA) protein
VGLLEPRSSFAVTTLESTPAARGISALSPRDVMLAEIFVSANQLLLAKYAIEQGDYIIGSDATCHIVVEAEQVARHHARLTFSGFELLIEDLGNGSGVYIDGVQVQIPLGCGPIRKCKSAAPV